VRAGVGIEGRAGIGVSGSAEASFSRDRVGFRLSGSASLGLGIGGSVDLSVNPTAIANGIGNAASGAWRWITGR
jgi:hypothetical protein